MENSLKLKTSELIAALEDGKTLRKDLRKIRPSKYKDVDDYPWRLTVSGWTTDPSIAEITWGQAFFSLWTEKDFWEII